MSEEFKIKIISLKVHGVLDYVTVVGFAVLPPIVGFSGLPAYISYALAGIHLLMTILTNFPLGIFKVIPIALHRIVETIVGPLLIILPWLLGFSSDVAARYTFIAVGIVIVLVGILTDYFEAK